MNGIGNILRFLLCCDAIYNLTWSLYCHRALCGNSELSQMWFEAFGLFTSYQCNACFFIMVNHCVCSGCAHVLRAAIQFRMRCWSQDPLWLIASVIPSAHAAVSFPPSATSFHESKGHRSVKDSSQWKECFVTSKLVLSLLSFCPRCASKSNNCVGQKFNENLFYPDMW